MTVRFTQSNGIARIVLDDPARRNALGWGTLEAILDSVNSAQDDDARCILLSAQGSVFSAGADFNDLTGTAADTHFDDAVSKVTTAFRSSSIPVVAVVDGPCLGAAVDVVTSTDVVIATQSARFGVPAARLGILYNPDSLVAMHSRITGSLMRTLMLGISVSADEALAGGLVSKVVDPTELEVEVQRVTEKLGAAVGGAIGATKGLIRSLDEGTFDRAYWQQVRLNFLDSTERLEIINSRKRPSPL